MVMWEKDMAVFWSISLRTYDVTCYDEKMVNPHTPHIPTLMIFYTSMFRPGLLISTNFDAVGYMQEFYP